MQLRFLAGGRSVQCGRAIGIVALSASALLLAIGCSLFQTSSDAKRVSKDIPNWAMPLNEFVVYSSELDNYAEQLLVRNCLGQQNHAWTVIPRDTDFPTPENRNSVGATLFNADIAERWGYGSAPHANPGEAEALQRQLEISFATAYSTEFDAAFDSCLMTVRRPDALEAQDASNYVTSLSWQALETALQRPEVIEAVAKWRECLQPQTHFQLGSDPWTETPTREMSDAFGTREAGEPPPPQEVELAVADATCRESSGATEALYNAEWDEETKLIDENRARLDRDREAAVKRHAELLQTVAENAPDAQ